MNLAGRDRVAKSSCIILLAVTLLLVATLLTTACSSGEDRSIGYKYEAECLSRHAVSFYANDYEIQCDRVILYDAYVFQWGWKHVDCFTYPDGAIVTITERQGVE